MTYRQSNFDPAHHEEHPGRPLRPFDRWQWLGVVAGALGVVVLFLFLGHKLGAFRLPFEVSAGSVFVLCLSGNFLLHRDPNLAPGTLDGRRKLSLAAFLFALFIVAVDALT